jgi:hypothetical protein
MPQANTIRNYELGIMNTSNAIRNYELRITNTSRTIRNYELRITNTSQPAVRSLLPVAMRYARTFHPAADAIQNFFGASPIVNYQLLIVNFFKNTSCSIFCPEAFGAAAVVAGCIPFFSSFILINS